MGCSREEGLHLYSFRECKIDIPSLFKVRGKSSYFWNRVLLFCCPAAVLHVL